jgi:hypothetical protein
MFDAFCFDSALGRLVLCEEVGGDIWSVQTKAAQVQTEWPEETPTAQAACFSAVDLKRRMA